MYRELEQKEGGRKEKWFSQPDQVNNTPLKSSYFQNKDNREQIFRSNFKVVSLDRSGYNRESFHSSSNQNNDDDDEQIQELRQDYGSSGRLKDNYFCLRFLSLESNY